LFGGQRVKMVASFGLLNSGESLLLG
jgi:hypothetical protein